MADQNYSEPGIVMNRIQNDAYAGDYYKQKYGTVIPAKTSFGMPGEVETGTQQDVRNWIDGLTPPPAPSATPAPAPNPAPTANAGGLVAAGSSNYAPWNVTPEQTVEGRIASIINGGSPIIAQARAGAVDAMNARGLSNSSLATTASDAAAYQAAIPIASADAATTAKASGYNADIQNQIGMQGRQLASQEKQAQLGADTQKYTAQLNADTQRYVSGLSSQTQVQVQQMQQDNQKLLQTNGNAAQAFNQSMVAIANIEQNDKMDAAAKQQAIAQIMQNLQAQMRTIGTVANIDLSGTLNFQNMPGFDANGHWIGFPATPPAGGGGGDQAPAQAM
jgi:hypothetical protein